MKKFIGIIIFLVLILAGFVLYIFVSTGYFREINEITPGPEVEEISLPGTEDATISYRDHFMLISSDDRAATREGKPHPGGIYYLDLDSAGARPELLTADFEGPFHPHGISLLQLDSGLYRLWVINHTGSQQRVEVFDLRGHELTYVASLNDPLLISPNDLVAVNRNQFYVTNDHGYTSGLGRWMEDYLGLKASNVLFFDGRNFREVAGDIAYANGINYDRQSKRLFVASPRDFLVKVYQVAADYSLNHVDDVPLGTGPDNLEFDSEGNIWIGSHPNLLAFVAYAAGKKPLSPSLVIKLQYDSPGKYQFTTVFEDDGSIVSASSVAVPYGDRLFIGNVMDEKMVVVQRSNP